MALVAFFPSNEMECTQQVSMDTPFRKEDRQILGVLVSKGTSPSETHLYPYIAVPLALASYDSDFRQGCTPAFSDRRIYL